MTTMSLSPYWVHFSLGLLNLHVLFYHCSQFTGNEAATGPSSHDTYWAELGHPDCVGSALRVCVMPGPWSKWKNSRESDGLSTMLPSHDHLAQDLPFSLWLADFLDDFRSCTWLLSFLPGWAEVGGPWGQLPLSNLSFPSYATRSPNNIDHSWTS